MRSVFAERYIQQGYENKNDIAKRMWAMCWDGNVPVNRTYITMILPSYITMTTWGVSCEESMNDKSEV